MNPLRPQASRHQPIKTLTRLKNLAMVSLAVIPFAGSAVAGTTLIDGQCAELAKTIDFQTQQCLENMNYYNAACIAVSKYNLTCQRPPPVTQPDANPFPVVPNDTCGDPGQSTVVKQQCDRFYNEKIKPLERKVQQPSNDTPPFPSNPM